MIIDLYWLKDGKPIYQRQNLSFKEADEQILIKDNFGKRDFEQVELMLYTSPKGSEMPVDNVIVNKEEARRALHKFNDNIAKRKYKDVIYAD